MGLPSLFNAYTTVHARKDEVLTMPANESSILPWDPNFIAHSYLASKRDISFS
jgi:hypothetical protein